MKYFAEILEGKVNQVLVMDLSDADSIAWLKENVSKNDWVKTEINGSMRGKFAGIGDEYHEDIGCFIQKPYDSWVLDKDKQTYKAPQEKPLIEEDGTLYYWNEEKLKWIFQSLNNIKTSVPAA